MVEVDLASGEDAIRERLERSIHRCEFALEGESALAESPVVELPRITVVVPTIVKRIEALEKCLASLERLDYENYEVVIVDNRGEVPADDPLPSILGLRQGFRVVREGRPGASAARNRGAAESDGEVIAFTDDDVQVDLNWLRAIGTRMMEHPHLDVVSGLILPMELESAAQIWFERYYGGFGAERTYVAVHLERVHSRFALTRGSRISIRDVAGSLVGESSVYGIGAYVAGANMAFRKSTLDRLGGFDPDLGIGTAAQGGEDLDAIIRILWSGGTMAYEPRAFVRHQHRRDYEGLKSQLHGYGVGYTAMLSSLIIGDPRHLAGILSQGLPAAKRRVKLGWTQLFGKKSTMDADKLDAYQIPPNLVLAEVLGYVMGPWAYVKSRKASRKVSNG
ncbi:MAG: glycosyltransferase [Acidimicrobiaceae bacterium]|nr:glycosyltransferase [Acidimicrobiaceae bacterium]